MTNPIDKAALRALAEAADDRPYNADATTAFRAAVPAHKVLAMLDEWERTEHNRDMWKEQVATQAAQIEACRAEAARLDFIDSHKSGCIRLDDRAALSPLYLYWREHGDVKTAREAIDMGLPAMKGTP